ncbi:MAG: FAD:protein FMN transferase [Sphingobacteriia bacterium]|nr:FAD:protein FMN transferase [Sphingobacteriia bacterium]
MRKSHSCFWIFTQPKLLINFKAILFKIWIFAGFLLIVSCVGEKPLVEQLRWEGRTMGTSYMIKVAVIQGDDATMLNFDSLGNFLQEAKIHLPTQEQLDSVLDRVNASLSTYRSESILSQFNRCARCFPVDSMIRRNFIASLAVHQASSGAFDPSVYPLVQAWGFGPGRNDQTPDSAKVQELLQLVGLGQFAMVGDSLCKGKPNQMLDFSAIAKGYGVDVVGWYLESLGIRNYLVEIGGEIRASGWRSAGQPWTVAVEKPLDDPSGQQRAALLQIPVKNRSMASSGNYRNFYMLNGVKVAHTIQASTGYPTPSDVLAATILAEDCMTADAYATACMALGSSGAKAMLMKHPELEAILVISHPKTTSGYTLYATKGMKAYLP